MPLQLREGAPGLEVWTRSQDTGHAGWVDQQVTDLERNFLIENVLAIAKERHLLRPFCLGPTDDLHSSGIGLSGLATIDVGSTFLQDSCTGSYRWGNSDLVIQRGHLCLTSQRSFPDQLIIR